MYQSSVVGASEASVVATDGGGDGPDGGGDLEEGLILFADGGVAWETGAGCFLPFANCIFTASASYKGTESELLFGDGHLNAL